MTTETPTRDELRRLLREIHDEAASALTYTEAAIFEKALSNIIAMARYEFDPTPEHDRVRNIESAG